MVHSLHIKVIEARDLKAADSSGFSDPYCRLQIGEDKKKAQKTKHVKRTLHPKWQEVFVFDGVSTSEKLEIEVKDWNIMGSSKTLGRALLPFAPIPIGPKPQELWLPLKASKENKEYGAVHLLVALVVTGDAVDMDDVRLAFHQQQVQEGNAILLVEVVEGRNLAVKDLTGTSDPYCVLSVTPPLGTSSSYIPKEHRTCIVFKSLDPVWNEEFFFEVPFENGTLEVEVWDWDRIGSHDAMGIAKMPLAKLADELFHDEWFTLVPIKKEKVSGDIRMRLQFTSALNAQKSYQLAKTHLVELCKIFTEGNDCTIASALLQLYESQELARAIVHVFHSQYSVNSLLNHCFHREIRRTTAETTLFRTDSPATRTTIVFFKLEDKTSSWLSKTLLPLINRVIQNPGGFEVDPEKAKEDKVSQDVKVNAKNLLATSQQFLDSIIGSLELCPPTIRLVLSNLRRLVSQAFPKSGLMAVGGIIFLRFICPAIFAPEGFGLVSTPPSGESRRALTLIAKILQNLVNGVEFGGKEQFMVEFNPFIVINATRITEFLDRLSSPPPFDMVPAKYTEEDLLRSMSVVVKNLTTNFQKVETLVKDPRVCLDMAKTSEVLKHLDELKKLLL